RVWMDHGVWPLLTVDLYLQQTGDHSILLEKAPYFKDAQQNRARKKDVAWREEDGKELKTPKGEVYQGTLLEHILVQHLISFHNVGEHNMIALEDADWNDGLDMARERGESVAFTAQYAGNLRTLAGWLNHLEESGVASFSLPRELLLLLGHVTGNG